MRRRDLFKALAATATVSAFGSKMDAIEIIKPPKHRVVLGPGTYVLEKPLIVDMEGSFVMTNCTIYPSGEMPAVSFEESNTPSTFAVKR